MAKTEPTILSESQVSGVTQQLYASIADRLYSARQMRKTADELESAAKKELAELIEPIMVEHGDKLAMSGWVVSRRATVSKRIDADLLLGRGVSPDIIKDCTKESRSFAYIVSRLGEAVDQG